jgi:tetratricopeptide (TPR) repeat protein
MYGVLSNCAQSSQSVVRSNPVGDRSFNRENNIIQLREISVMEASPRRELPDALDPQWPHIDYLLGGVEASLGRFEDAEQRLRKEIGRDPNSFEANDVLGALLSKEAKYNEATPFLEQALKDNPKHS